MNPFMHAEYPMKSARVERRYAERPLPFEYRILAYHHPVDVGATPFQTDVLRTATLAISSSLLHADAYQTAHTVIQVRGATSGWRTITRAQLREYATREAHTTGSGEQHDPR